MDTASKFYGPPPGFGNDLIGEFVGQKEATAAAFDEPRNAEKGEAQPLKIEGKVIAIPGKRLEAMIIRAEEAGLKQAIVRMERITAFEAKSDSEGDEIRNHQTATNPVDPVADNLVVVLGVGLQFARFVGRGEDKEVENREHDEE